MKRLTLAMPSGCKHCDATNHELFEFDWSGFRCRNCGGWTTYTVVKEEEIPDAELPIHLSKVRGTDHAL
jgi:hypothetical protein